MTIKLSDLALDTSRLMLSNLAHILAKGEAFAAQRNIDPLVLTSDRLAPDMFALTRQVQIACDVVKNGLARLAGAEAPKFEDHETSFPELLARIHKTLAYVQTCDAAAIDAAQDKAIVFPIGGDRTHTLKGDAYVSQWMLPNLFFHVTTTYAILRHNGVGLGKADYLRGEQAQ